MNKSYDHYANHVYEQATLDPDVDHQDSDEIIEYSRELAELLVLDPDELQSRVIEMEETRTMTRF